MTKEKVQRFSIRARLKSFRYAFNGIRSVCVTQPNFRIHTAAALVVVTAGILLRVSTIEWGILLLAIGGVMAMETMNSAIEKLVDYVSPEFNKEAGMVKDMAAGAVLLASLTAAIAGMAVFLPKIIALCF
jgi:diacylglycerol kinase (ATP)